MLSEFNFIWALRTLEVDLVLSVFLQIIIFFIALRE